LFVVDWIEQNSIGHDPLIYIGGGLIPVGNLPSHIFLVFHEFKIVPIGISKARSEQLLGLPEVKSEVGSELPTFVGNPYVSQNSRLGSELPIAEHLLEDITSSSSL